MSVADNVLCLRRLVLNGMKHQPCNPSFFDARDAIIEADQVLTGGENFCELWEGFSARGLGPDARVDGRTPWGGGFRTNVCCSSCYIWWTLELMNLDYFQDYSVPLACKTAQAEW